MEYPDPSLNTEDLTSRASPQAWMVRGEGDERVGLSASTTSIALLLVVLSAASLLGAFWLPFMHAEFSLQLPDWIPDSLAVHVREWLVLKGRLPVGDHYLWGVVCNLFSAHEYLVGWAILLFSVVFPVLKIALGVALTAGRHLVSRRTRRHMLRMLAMTAKWSMADVFIVGMIIVFFKADGFHFTFTARPGMYCYAAAALLSSAAVHLIQTRQPVGNPGVGVI